MIILSIVITGIKPKGKYPKLVNGSISLEEVPTFNYVAVSQASSSREGGNLMMSELHGERENLKEVVLPRKDQIFVPHNISSSVKSCANFVLRLPVQLSGEVIEDITCGFKKGNFADKINRTLSYVMDSCRVMSRVLIKRFTGDCGAILEAEKASAVSMHHKNILRMIGYHKTENSSVLVFPFAARWSLDKNLPGKFLLPIVFKTFIHLVVEIAYGNSSQVFTLFFLFLFFTFFITGYPGICPD